MKLINSLLLSLVTSLFIYSPAIATDSLESQVIIQEKTILYVNINTADIEMLADLLVGVGEKKAQAIINHREQVGLFTTADDLLAVKGIGPSILEKNRPAILVDTVQKTDS